MSLNPPDGSPLYGDPTTGLTRKALLQRSLAGAAAASSLSLLLQACGGGDSNATGTGAASGKAPTTPTGTLRLAIASQPRILDPTLTFSVGELAVLGAVYEGLTRFNHDYRELVPSLATRWEVSDDAREWRFTLREGVKFHDGADFDATAVRRSIEFFTREASLLRFAVGEPEVDDSDPGVAVFKYKEPMADLARNWVFLVILSPKLLDGSPSAAAKRVGAATAGTGPYQLAGQLSNRDLTLTAFDGYWGEGPYLAELRTVVLPEESARNAALQAGDVDLVMQLPPTVVDTVTGSDQAKVVAVPSWSGTGISVACKRSPFDDARVRQAISYAVDRQAIVDAVLRGRADAMVGAVPEGVYGFKEAATPLEYDPEKAKQLLADAGITTPLEATLATTADAVLGQEIVQALAAQLNEVGFKVTPRVMDGGVLAKDQFDPNQKIQLVYFEAGWVTGGPFHFTNNYNQTTHYSNKQFDAMVTKMTNTPDGPERERVIGEAIDFLAEELPVVPLWVPERIDGTANAVEGYYPPPNVYAQFDDTYIAA